MAYTSLISNGGQVSVPQEIQARLGLKEGDRLEFVIEGDRTIIRPAQNLANPFEEFVGALDTFPNGVQGIKAWLDDLRKDESTAK